MVSEKDQPELATNKDSAAALSQPEEIWVAIPIIVISHANLLPFHKDNKPLESHTC
jgi:hypothetical protein